MGGCNRQAQDERDSDGTYMSAHRSISLSYLSYDHLFFSLHFLSFLSSFIISYLLLFSLTSLSIFGFSILHLYESFSRFHFFKTTLLFCKLSFSCRLKRFYFV